MINVVIAEDHPIVREGLKQILVESSDINITAEVDNGRDIISQMFTMNCDVVLLDISMPGMSGLEVLQQLKVGRPELPVLILSIYPEEQYAVRALKAGASGYLSKSTAPEELVKAIRKVAGGGKYITASLAELMATQFYAEDSTPSYKKLSNREFEVMRCIAKGMTIKQIADALAVSVKTISTYRSRILEKLGLTNTSQIIGYALRERLVDGE